ncbi:MAG: MBL fold metallo-hydrolase [Planctomycetota bacterium]
MGESSFYEQALALFLAQAKEPPTRPPRASASIVPWRMTSDGRLEVYWVKRSRELGVLGGWHAFPGGGIAKSDIEVRVLGDPVALGDIGPGGTPFGSRYLRDERLGPTMIPGLLAGAIRELFEETGLLLASGYSSGNAPLPNDLLAPLRADLLAEKQSFQDLLRAHQLVADASSLVYAGRWITPSISPMRFDNRFFLLEWDVESPIQPKVIPGELESGEWIRPADAMEAWRRREVLAAPPTLYILDILAEAGPKGGLPRLQTEPVGGHDALRRFLEPRPGVILLPLVTPTLPPANATTSFLLGADEAVLIDVGTHFPSELDRLQRSLAIIQEEMNRKVSAIWLTHHHPDHVGGVEQMRKVLNVPVVAHPDTADRLAERGIHVDAYFRGGERILLAGNPPVSVRVLHTPGHAAGHLAFLEEHAGSVIAGDLVAGTGTVIIDPPEGNMTDYLASLALLAEFQPRTLFPSHGPVIANALETLETYIKHRLAREAKVIECWDSGITDIAAMLPIVYSDASPKVYPLAARQIEAHLHRLREIGRISSQ